MSDNKHCPDHCDLNATVVTIANDTKWIKERLSASWGDVKWLVALIPGVIALILNKFQ